MIAYQNAEINRDRKSRRNPFQISEFYCYPDIESKDTIDAIYSRAAFELIRIGKFPNWALFVYKELSQNATKGKIPEKLCYANDIAIILAPQISGRTCKGMLIAMEAADKKILELISENGDILRVRMPDILGKTVAIENCYLDLA